MSQILWTCGLMLAMAVPQAASAANLPTRSTSPGSAVFQPVGYRGRGHHHHRHYSSYRSMQSSGYGRSGRMMMRRHHHRHHSRSYGATSMGRAYHTRFQR